MPLPAILRAVNRWAETGDRQLPESVGLSRAEGWPAAYEQVGGRGPERGVVQQLLFEITSYIYTRVRYGVMQWDAGLDYHARAIVADGAVLYISGAATGPGHGNVTRPSEDAARTIWRPY